MVANSRNQKKHDRLIQIMRNNREGVTLDRFFKDAATVTQGTTNKNLEFVLLSEILHKSRSHFGMTLSAIAKDITKPNYKRFGEETEDQRIKRARERSQFYKGFPTALQHLIANGFVRVEPREDRHCLGSAYVGYYVIVPTEKGFRYYCDSYSEFCNSLGTNESGLLLFGGEILFPPSLMEVRVYA